MSSVQFSVETDDGQVILFCVACGNDIVSSENGFTLEELIQHSSVHDCAEMKGNHSG